MPLMVKLTSPLFVSVTAFEALVVFLVWLANAKLTGESVPAAPIALPTVGTTAGDPGKFPETSKVPENGPREVGANVTSKPQLAPAGMLAPQ